MRTLGIQGSKSPWKPSPLSDLTPAQWLRLKKERNGALKLQRVGLIRYARGRITILDRDGLERRTCECYAVVKREYDRLLPPAIAD